jgi:histidinol-phosphatase (PHP family)
MQTFQAKRVMSRHIDYVVGSVHFLGSGEQQDSFDGTEERFRQLLSDAYNGDIREMVRDYYRRMSQVKSLPKLLIAGHFDLIKRWNQRKTYFTGEETWYRDAANQALESLASSEILIELNTAGWGKGLGEPYPSEWILRRCTELGLHITVSADSHEPGALTDGYTKAVDLLDSFGVHPVNPARYLTT